MTSPENRLLSIVYAIIPPEGQIRLLMLVMGWIVGLTTGFVAWGL